MSCLHCDGSDGYHDVGCCRLDRDGHMHIDPHHTTPVATPSEDAMPIRPLPAAAAEPTALLAASGKPGIYYAASTSTPGRTYLVAVVDLAAESVICNCRGFRWGRPCWHAREALRLEQQARIRDLSAQRRHAS